MILNLTACPSEQTNGNGNSGIFHDSGFLILAVHMPLEYKYKVVTRKNVSFNVKGGTQTEGVWEQGAEEDSLTDEGWGDGNVKETA
jgi:hypothetical protein